MKKNIAGQKWTVFAFNKLTNEPVTGDAAQITAKIRKDYGTLTATNDVNPTELEDGYYDFDLTQAETNADELAIFPESSTSDIAVIGAPASFTTIMGANLVEIDGVVNVDATLPLKKLQLINDDLGSALIISNQGGGSAVSINSDSSSTYPTIGVEQYGAGDAIDIVAIDPDSRGMRILGGEIGLLLGGFGSGKACQMVASTDEAVLEITNVGGTGSCLGFSAGGGGKDISAKEIDEINTKIGTPIALSGGAATLSDNNVKMADNAGGATFDSATDSLAELQGQVVSGVPEDEVATAQTLTTVGTVGGTFANTETQDDVYLSVAPNGAALADFYLTFQVEDKVLSSLLVNGRTAGGAGDRGTDVWAYDWQADPTGVSASWQQLSGLGNRIAEGVGSIADANYPYSLLNKHRSSTGEVRIRFTSLRVDTTDIIYLDQVLVKAVASGLTAGQIADAVWLQGAPVLYNNAIHIDTVNGVPGSIVQENGTPNNPVNNLADAYLLSVALSTPIFFIRNGSQLQLDRDYTGYTFLGTGYSLDLNGQEIAFTKFTGANLEGLGTSIVPAPVLLEQCRTQSTGLSLPAYSMAQCALGDGVTATAAGTYTMDFCSSGVAGTGTPSFTFIANVVMNLRHYSGGMEVKLMGPTNTMSMEGQGQLIINSNCTGGLIVLRGNFDVTDYSGGVVTLIQTANYTTSQLDLALTDITGAVVGAIPELGIGKPTATPTLKQAAMLQHMALRNIKTENGTYATISNDAGTTIAKSATSDIAGTFTSGELQTP